MGAVAGFLLGCVYTVVWGGLLIGPGMARGDGMGNASPWICQQELTIIISQAVLLVVFGVLAVPVSRRFVLRLQRGTAIDAFLGTLATAMFVPFLPCGTAFGASSASGIAACL